MKVLVAVSGASGVVLAKRLLEELRGAGHETHVVVSDGAVDVAGYEGGISRSNLEALASFSYKNDDLAASIASSSNRLDAMAVVPCSMKTLAAIAHGYADNLIVRAAENFLKMNWKLVVVPRETPLSLSAIENMAAVKRAGAVVLPPVVGYYSKPESIGDVNDFLVGKILDALGVEHELYGKWKGK